MYDDDPYCRVVDRTPCGGVKYCDNNLLGTICDSHQDLLHTDAHLVEKITDLGFWVTYCPEDSSWFIGGETPAEGFHPLVLQSTDTPLFDDHAVREIKVMVDWDMTTDLPVYETMEVLIS